MRELRCNRALREAGLTEGVTRHSLQAQRVKRPTTQHLGPKATAMTRNGCRLRKAEANREITLSSRRIAEIERHLRHVKKNHAYRVSHNNPDAWKSAQMRSPIWQKRATRIDPTQSPKETSPAVRGRGNKPPHSTPLKVFPDPHDSTAPPSYDEVASRLELGIDGVKDAYPSVAKAVHRTVAIGGWPRGVRSGGDRR
jgi:hypothetical protein